MKLRPVPRRGRGPEEKPQAETIVALIDVVFFLLVFFILVGRMDATAPFDLIPPTAESPEAAAGGRADHLGRADGRLALDGAVLEPDTCSARPRPGCWPSRTAVPDQRRPGGAACASCCR